MTTYEDCWHCDQRIIGEPYGDYDRTFCEFCFDLIPPCRDCGNKPDGAKWNGRCFDCHNASLLPPSSFEDECIGLNTEACGHPLTFEFAEKEED